MFDFLFSNPIIIIILIGVISSLLKKKNNPNQQKTGQPQAPKPIWKQVIQEVKEEWLEEKKRFQRRFKRQKEFLLLTIQKRKKKESGLRSLNACNKNMREKDTSEVGPTSYAPSVFPIATKTKLVPVASLNVISDEKSPVYNKELSFGKQELINGIIMSEVLGPPRSKRIENNLVSHLKKSAENPLLFHTFEMKGGSFLWHEIGVNN